MSTFKSNIDRTLIHSADDMAEWMDSSHRYYNRYHRGLSVAAFKRVATVVIIPKEFVPAGTNYHFPIRDAEGQYEFMRQASPACLLAADVGAIQQKAREAAHKENVRATASRIGLSFWPALLQRTADSAAYIAAEKILIPKHGEYGRESHGGWDSQGFYGISSWQVDKYWYLAGCKDTSKFRWLVAHHDTVKWIERTWGYRMFTKGTTIGEMDDILRGTQWLYTVRSTYVEGIRWISPKVFRTLGRMSAPLRWAAISGINFNREPGSQKLRVRALNWAAVAAVQNRKVPRDHYVDSRIKKWKSWYSSFKPMYQFMNAGWNKSGRKLSLRSWHNALGEPNLREMGVSPKTIMALVEREKDFSAATLIPAWNLAVMFGKNTTAMNSFIDARGSVHDAGQFILPSTRISPCWGGWLAAKPSLIAKTSLFALAEEFLGGPPATLEEAVRGVAGVSPPPGSDALDAMTDYQRGAYLALMPQVKTWEAIPAPYIEEGKYTLSQLAVGDIRAPMAGVLTDCCQHLHGAAATCAALSFTSPYVAVWAVFKDEDMVAQSLVWKSRDESSLVMDSVEALGNQRNNTAIAQMFLAAGRQVVGKLGVTQVLLSRTSYGMTDTVNRVLGEDLEYTDLMPAAVNLGYSDATNTLCTVASASKVAPMVQLPAGELPTSLEYDAPCINELADDSDVYCEFCEAEVHPLCCICPSCGEDITGWVE